MGHLNLVNFKCDCGARFEAEPAEVVDCPEKHWHPFSYFTVCPDCGNPETPQVYWEINRLKANFYATGPKTEAGKAASAANLEGHPTPEEAQLTRFNALKHGAYASTASYFPPRPGGYEQCAGCQYLENRDCVPARACLSRLDLFLKVQVAHETGNPGMLTSIMADHQAGVLSIISEMIRSIAANGVQFDAPVWHGDKEGGIHFVETHGPDGVLYPVMEHTANPLLRILADFLAKNHMTLADLNMTPKGQQDGELLSGYLDAEEDDKADLMEFQQRQTAALEKVQQMIERSQTQTRRDPILIEHSEGGG